MTNRRTLRRRATLGGALILSLVGAACGTPAQGSEPPPSAAATPAADAFSECVTDELRAPNGDRLDLTGTWQASGGGDIYFLSQVGSCVSWAGGFPPSQEAVDAFGSVYGWRTVVFQGRVDSSFTLRGRWMETRQAPEHRGPIGYGETTWEIGFEDGQATTVTSRGTGQEGGDEVLTKISDDFLEPP